jgi:hypothetical protein
MTDIETRLREGLRAEAARVQPHLLRELRIPPRRRLRGSWRRSGLWPGPRMLPWLAPVAAALAVIAVISGVRLTVDSRPPGPPRATPQVTAAAPATPVPPYYVAANFHTQAKAWVYDSVTGQVLAKVGVAGQLPIGITAAADDRTFALVFQDLYRPAFVTFMGLTLGADGHPAAYRRLPVNLPAGTSFGEMALSPDGQTLAMSLSIEPSQAAIEANPKVELNRTTEIELISLRTSASRTWVAAPGVGIGDLSWARGAQTLAFLASRRGGSPNDSLGQVRVLNVSHPPGGLMTSSTAVRLRTAGGQVQAMLVTDNGARVIAWVRMPSHPAKTGRGPLVLAEYSTRTGQQLQVFSRLRTANADVGYGQLFSADPSGQHILFFSDGSLSSKTVHYPTTPSVDSSAPPAGSTFVPAAGSISSPGTFTPSAKPGAEAPTDTFFGRLDNGRVTVLPSPAQDPTEFGAW